jgi:uncharacterized protein YndB with AHSA1/START domain
MNRDLSPAVAAVAAVDRRVTVRLSPDEAFALFTREMRAWWPFVGHSCGDESGGDVQFEPRAGGAVTEIGRDGTRWAWGTLSEWDPPHAFAMAWHPGLSPDQATLLRVTFSRGAAGTEVRVRHTGWDARGASAAEKRDQYDTGWPATLAAFAEAAARQEAA